MWKAKCAEVFSCGSLVRSGGRSSHLVETPILAIAPPQLRREHCPAMAVCTRHPEEQTYLACAGCDRAFCYRCLIQGPVGSKCRDCSRGIAPTATKRERLAVTAAGVSGQRYVAANAVLALVLGANVLMLGVSQGSGVSLGGPDRFSLDIWAMNHGELWRIATGAVVNGSIITVVISAALVWWLGRHLAARMSTVAFVALSLVALSGGVLLALLASPGAGSYAGLGLPGGLLGAYVVGRKRNVVSKIPMPFDPRLGFGLFFVGWMVFGALSSERGGAAAALGGAVAALPVAWLLFDPFDRDRKSKKPLVIAAVLVIGLFAASAGFVRTHTGTDPKSIVPIESSDAMHQRADATGVSL
jgi:membrane associated rhomboid family serine protease